MGHGRLMAGVALLGRRMTTPLALNFSRAVSVTVWVETGHKSVETNTGKFQFADKPNQFC
jgi:hypothetical protein